MLISLAPDLSKPFMSNHADGWKLCKWEHICKLLVTKRKRQRSSRMHGGVYLFKPSFHLLQIAIVYFLCILGLMLSQFHDSNRDSFKAESSERDEDVNSSGSDSAADGDDQCELEPFRGAGSQACSDSRRSCKVLMHDGARSSTAAEEAFRIDDILPSSFIKWNVAKAFTMESTLGQTFHGYSRGV